MKKVLLRIALYVVVFVVFFAGVGLTGVLHFRKNFYLTTFDQPAPSLQGIEPPVYDPQKPTVAVLMGNVTTEDFDFLIPYDLFSRTDAFNVYAVAPDKNIKPLTGGLDVVPHFTLAEIDAKLGKSPDIIVVPQMVRTEEEGYKPIREYLQKHADTTIISICGGAENLADTGLLKGKMANDHWQGISAAKSSFPDTTWRDDLRYVDNGNIIVTGGQMAGFDGVLHLIAKKLGDSAALKVAQEIHYPTYSFVTNPKVDPFKVDYRLSTYYLNNAFQWNKTNLGVMLYNGMDEMDLSTIFDTYADTGTTRVLTLAASEHPIVTKHHLNLISRHTFAQAPNLDRLIVPGTDAKTLAASDVAQWNQKGTGLQPLYIHADQPDRFVFEAPLEDLAKQEDVLTAQHAVKRLEYRANHVTLDGPALPYETYGELLLLTMLVLMVTIAVDRRFLLKKAQVTNSSSMIG
ncbi:MAG: DJ-1/PfpI family protein [Tumebacillaceae bacterium]